MNYAGSMFFVGLGSLATCDIIVVPSFSIVNWVITVLSVNFSIKLIVPDIYCIAVLGYTDIHIAGLECSLEATVGKPEAFRDFVPRRCFLLPRECHVTLYR